MVEPLLLAQGVEMRFGATPACLDVGLQLWPGEVMAVVGESGSGKTTLLRILSGHLRPDSGRVRILDETAGGYADLHTLSPARLRALQRGQLGLVHQNPRDGLRLDVSAGANICEPLMARGDRHYGRLREQAGNWLREVEIDPLRIDDTPRYFSGGMQQRLQIARTLAVNPRLVFMDEPTGGLDVSVQARLLDLIRDLVNRLGLAVLLVTHDLGVARLLSQRMLVMQAGRVVESGLTDQVLDDPQHPYTQLLVASVLH